MNNSTMEQKTDTINASILPGLKSIYDTCGVICACIRGLRELRRIKRARYGGIECIANIGALDRTQFTMNHTWIVQNIPNNGTRSIMLQIDATIVHS